MLLHLKASLFLLAAAGASCFAADSKLGDTPFQSLAKGRHLKVSYTVKGCFAHSVYDFDFHRDRDLVVDVAEIVDTRTFGGVDVAGTQVVPLGSIHLSKDDAAKLDLLVATYRGKNRSAFEIQTPEGFSESVIVTGGNGAKPFTEDLSNGSRRSAGGLLTFPELAHRLTQRFPRMAAVPEELRPQAVKAQKVCSEMRGLELLNDVFNFDSALVTNPKTLNVRLKSVTIRLINSVSWSAPLKNGDSVFDWKQLLSFHSEAERALAQHAWLAEWKKQYGERSLELQLSGAKVSQSGQEYTTHVLPLWKQAGFSGTPTYCVLARREQHSWLEFYFSDQDERALVYRAEAFDEGVRGNLDELDLSWDPKAKAGDEHANYAVIDKEGQCHVASFVPSVEKRVATKR